MPSRAITLVGCAYVAALAVVVLAPVGYAINRATVGIYVLWNYDLGLPGQPSPERFGDVLNVLLFIPLGALLSRRLRWHHAVAASAGVAGTIELVQALPFLERQTSFVDVACNALGGLIGALAMAAIRRRRAGRPQHAQSCPD